MSTVLALMYQDGVSHAQPLYVTVCSRICDLLKMSACSATAKPPAAPIQKLGFSTSPEYLSTLNLAFGPVTSVPSRIMRALPCTSTSPVSLR
ncbi:hypothetical protein G6F68_019878 [Rhizopus microsporus]|nr:hypothetical protein G6F68_019878 [Rhizopus microsporus]